MSAAERARRRVLWMNLLFAAGLALAVPWFAAGVLAHWWGPAKGTLWATHHAYAVRTFWFGLLGLLALITVPGFGLPLMGIAWVWCAARMVRAFHAWDGEEWISQPGRLV